MTLRTCRNVTFQVALVCLLGGHPTGPLQAQPTGAEQRLPAILTAKPLKPEPGDDELRKLLKDRYNAAATELHERYADWLVGRLMNNTLTDCAQRLLTAGLELSDKSADQVALLTDFVALAKEAEKLTQAHFDSGRRGRGDLEQIRYFRMDAEIRLLRAKAKQKVP